tara:strand:- start:293 stop:517 length:225 start_codon:yes stop_codon:yes gene_type:complete
VSADSSHQQKRLACALARRFTLSQNGYGTYVQVAVRLRKNWRKKALKKNRLMTFFRQKKSTKKKRPHPTKDVTA